MAREIKARWVERDEVYVAPLGVHDPKRQRYRDVVLRDPSGERIRRDDQAGKAAALARLIQERDEARRRQTGPTVADIAVAYLDWHRAQKSAERTIADHRRWLERFGKHEHDGIPYCDRPAASIVLADLSRIRKTMKEAGNDDSYVRHLYLTVRACWAWAARPIEDREPAKLIPGNPFEKLLVPSAGGSDDKFVPPEVTFTLIDFLEGRCRTVHPNGRRKWDRYTTAFQLVALSGCRPSEAAELRWSEVQWDSGVIVIPHKEKRTSGRRHKTGKKTGKPRVIAIPDESLEKLRAYYADPTRHPEFVFWVGVRPTGRKFYNWFREVRLAASAAGVPLHEECTLYWFRHSWQTIGMEVSSVENVALAAGNSPQVVVSTYVTARAKKVREVSRGVVETMREAGKNRGVTPPKTP